MGAKDLVGKLVLVKIGCMPKEVQRKARVPYDIVKVLGCIGDVGMLDGVIVDGFGYGQPYKDVADIVIEECETYWFIDINDIEEVLE